MPPAPATTILDLFLHWARAMLTLLVFSFNKTSAALELLQAYKSFVHVTSRAGPLLQSLDLGITDKKDAHNLGKELIHYRDIVATRAQVYFPLKHPLHSNQGVIEQFHRFILIGFTLYNQNALTGLRNARDSNTLHLRMIGDNPLNPLQWGELQPLAALVDRFFSDLRKFKPDPLSLTLYQAPSKKSRRGRRWPCFP